MCSDGEQNPKPESMVVYMFHLSNKTFQIQSEGSQLQQPGRPLLKDRLLHLGVRTQWRLQ